VRGSGFIVERDVGLAINSAMDVNSQQLKQAIEVRHGGIATFIQAVPVKEVFDGRTVWERVVHIFRLKGNLITDIAYAWSDVRQGDLSGEVFTVLRVPPVSGPRDAVRSVIIAEDRASKPP
jgi:hypothetical protein